MRPGDIAEVFVHEGVQYRDYSVFSEEGFDIIQDGRFWRHDERPSSDAIFSPEGLWLAPALREARARTDATLLRGEATEEEVRAWAEEMSEIEPRNVCVFPAHLESVLPLFPRPATVVSFPHGASTPEGKIAEIREAEAAGAGEIDVVAPLRQIGTNWKAFEEEIRLLARSAEVPLKVILETALFPEEDVMRATKILEDAGIFCAKTSTGTGDGASAEAVFWMREASPEIEIKASGGVRSRLLAGEMQRAGATIFGASNLQEWD